MAESINDSKEFMVMNFVIHFCRAQGTRVVADSAKFLLISRVLLL